MTFGLFKEGSTAAAFTATTGANGKAVFTLGADSEGTYTLHETNGLEGYVWDADMVIDTITVTKSLSSETLINGKWQRTYTWFVATSEIPATENPTILVKNVPTRALTVTKEVDGIGASETRYFDFTVEFGNGFVPNNPEDLSFSCGTVKLRPLRISPWARHIRSQKRVRRTTPRTLAKRKQASPLVP